LESTQKVCKINSKALYRMRHGKGIDLLKVVYNNAKVLMRNFFVHNFVINMKKVNIK